MALKRTSRRSLVARLHGGQPHVLVGNDCVTEVRNGSMKDGVGRGTGAHLAHGGWHGEGGKMGPLTRRGSGSLAGGEPGPLVMGGPGPLARGNLGPLVRGGSGTLARRGPAPLSGSWSLQDWNLTVVCGSTPSVTEGMIPSKGLGALRSRLSAAKELLLAVGHYDVAHGTAGQTVCGPRVF